MRINAGFVTVDLVLNYYSNTIIYIFILLADGI